jgi:predicted MPP superfamily phosphohydrolase
VTRFLLFFLALTLMGAYTGLHGAQLAPGHPEGAAAATLAFVWLLLGWQLAYRKETFPHEAAWARACGWAASVSLGAWSAFLFFCAAADVASLFGLPAPIGARAAAAGAAFVAVLGVLEARRGPRAPDVTVIVAGLPPALDGLRVAHISDLHVGPTIRRAEVEAVVERTRALEPDLVAITGDLVDGPVARLSPHVEPLRGLAAPLGVYYVTGNHEYYWDAPGWIAKVRQLGLTPLINESRVVARGGAKVLVGGVTDETGGLFVRGHAPDFERAAATDESPSVKILLAHRPTGHARAERAGFDLQLSGHTHGGQFFPWSLVIPLFHRYYRGLNRHGRLTVYVSSGTGYWGPALRFGVPAEIALLTLRRG